MTPPAPSVQQLIETVTGTDALQRLQNAAVTAQELQTAGDALLDHFVGECRAAGHSWSEISTALGVTKQAVHKRFSVTPTFERFTNRARSALHEAKSAAVGLGQQYIGTEHMLVGLFPPGGVAAEALKDFKVTKAKVEKLLPKGDAKLTVDDPVPFTPHGKDVLERALREALGLSHNYIGTEHLLLGLVATEECRGAGILRDLGADAAAVRTHVLDVLRDYVKNPR